MASSKARKSFRRTDMAAIVGEDEAFFGPRPSDREKPKGRMHRVTIEMEDGLYLAARRYLLEPEAPYRTMAQMVRSLLEREVGAEKSDQ